MPGFNAGKDISLTVNSPDLAVFAIELFANGLQNSRQGFGRRCSLGQDSSNSILGVEPCLHPLAVGDVQHRPDVAEEIALWTEARRGRVGDPPILAVMTAETVIQPERL